MDLDRLMIEWHEQTFEGYLFETPSSVITAEIRKKAEKRHRKYRLREFAGIALAVVIAAGTIVAISLEHSLMVRAATLILMAANFRALLWVLRWRAEEYKKPYCLPARLSLSQERERIARNIRQTRWQVLYSGIAGCGGLAYLVLSFIFDLTSGDDVLDFLIAFSVPLLLIHFTELLDMRKELPRTLERIDRDIRRLAGDPKI